VHGMEKGNADARSSQQRPSKFPSQQRNDYLQDRRKHRTLTELRNHFPARRGKAGERE
jgi:hypothetical protein